MPKNIHLISEGILIEMSNQRYLKSCKLYSSTTYYRWI